jgi:hypothetical protein
MACKSGKLHTTEEHANNETMTISSACTAESTLYTVLHVHINSCAYAQAMAYIILFCTEELLPPLSMPVILLLLL